MLLLEAQILYNYLDVTDSLPNNVMFSFVNNIFVVVDRFGRSLWFNHLEFNTEAIFMVKGVKMAVIGEGIKFK